MANIFKDKFKLFVNSSSSGGGAGYLTISSAASTYVPYTGAIANVDLGSFKITAAAFVANTSGTLNDTATYGGYTIGQVVAALKAIGLLA